MQVKHCFWQANRYADVVTRMGSVQLLDYFFFHSLPVDVLEAFEADSNGMYFDRSYLDCAVVP